MPIPHSPDPRSRARRRRAPAASLAGVTLLLAACSSATPQPSAAPSSAAPTAIASSRPSASPASTPSPIPPARLQTVGVAYITTAPSSNTSTVTLVTLDGVQHTMALTQPGSFGLSPVDGGVVALDGGRLRELRSDGRIVDLGPVISGTPPVSSTAIGFQGIAVSPDATQVAWSVSTQSGAVSDNRLYVAPIGGTPRLLAERISDSSKPASPDAPLSWAYSVQRWVRQGILIVRLATGIDNFNPFQSENYDWDTALVDPQTGQATDLTNSPLDPLSGYSDQSGLAVTFPRTAPGTASAITITATGGRSTSYPLSGQDFAGSAVASPDGSRVAYATVPESWVASSPPSGPGDWEAAATLRVLIVDTGNAQAAGPTGLVPIAWTPDGRIVAKRTPDASTTATQSLVIVDPATGSVTTLSTPGLAPVGTVAVDAPVSQ